MFTCDINKYNNNNNNTNRNEFEMNICLCLNLLVMVVKNEKDKIKSSWQLIYSYFEKCVLLSKNDLFGYFHERLLVSYLMIIDSLISSEEMQQTCLLSLNILNEFKDTDNIINRKILGIKEIIIHNHESFKNDLSWSTMINLLSSTIQYEYGINMIYEILELISGEYVNELNFNCIIKFISLFCIYYYYYYYL